jgi:hypothetical protein
MGFRRAAAAGDPARVKMVISVKVAPGHAPSESSPTA